MKGKILQKAMAFILVFILLISNAANIAIAVGESIQGQSITIQNGNIEYNAYFKNEKGENVSSLDVGASNLQASLYLYLDVKNEGYISHGAQIELENSNFIIKEVNSEYVNSVKNNVITLNQVNAGRKAEIELKVEFERKNNFDLANINKESKVRFKGIYRNSTEKDINVEATKVVSLRLIKETNELDTNAEIITNKILNLNGQEKRLVQISINTALKNNSYPVKNIKGKIEILQKNGIIPEARGVINLNSMSHGSYEYLNGTLNFEYTNDPSNKNTVLWINDGKENLIITYIFDKDVNVEDLTVTTNIEATLYDDVKLNTTDLKTIVGAEEKEAIITSEIENEETTIYSGKIEKGIEREFSTTATVNVNAIGIVHDIEIKENNLLDDTPLNYIYTSSAFNKEELVKVLGDNGTLTIKDELGNVLKVIDKNTEADSNGNITVNYDEGKSNIIITATEPSACGKFTIKNNKAIKGNESQIVNAKKLITQVYIKDTLGERLSSSVEANIEQSKSEMELQIDKNSLSTIIENKVQLKAILKSNNEANRLFENPTIKITLPEDVKNIKLDKVELLYEDELKLKNPQIFENSITLELEGKQTKYKDKAIEGAIVTIDATLELNKKAASKDAKIDMDYTNITKETDGTAKVENGKSSVNVKVEAPTDVTVINSIEELAIEEMTQGTTVEKLLPIKTENKSLTSKIEIINNKNKAIENVRIMGDFPTDNDNNNMKINITSGIKAIEGARVYYTQNKAATNDIQNPDNAWTAELTNQDQVKKYLIIIDKMEPQSEILTSYGMTIAAEMEYNLQATLGYTVTYIDSETKVESSVKATDIKLTTGNGPVAEITLSAKVGNKELKNGDIVKAGEVIKYHLEIKNIGTEEIPEARVVAPIPEGTELVKEIDLYEYTGASYYKSVDKTNYEGKVSNLVPKKGAKADYEVRVKSDITNNRKIDNTAQIIYGEVTKTSNNISLIANSADIRISLKKVTDRNVKLYSSTPIKYFAIVENTSNSEKQNVKVATHFPEELEVKNVSIITGLKDVDVKNMNAANPEINATEGVIAPVNENEVVIDENYEVKEVGYSDEISIENLKAGEKKVICYETFVKDLNEDKTIEIYATAKFGNDEYRSNVWVDLVNAYKINMNMVANTDTQYVKAGDIIEYSINLKNESTVDVNGIEVADAIPDQCTVNSITKDGTNIEFTNNKNVVIPISLGAGQETNIKISAIVNESSARETAETISNQVVATIRGNEIAKTKQIVHIIEVSEENKENQPNEENQDNKENQEDNNNSQDKQDEIIKGDTADGDRIITGVAWIDENRNGQKDDNEEVLRNIKVKLLNVQTNSIVKDKNGKEISSNTDSTGTYVLGNINKGRYVVVFEYNNVEYSLTTYKASGITELNNSDAMKNKLVVEGEEKEVVSTDVITVDKENISGINIGLVKVQNFDLKLDKYVSKIIIQNPTTGTSIREYNNETMAKLELDAKTISGTTAIVEYKIVVSNVGEVEGYAKKIVDYLSNDYQFSSEMNKEWYKKGDNLYNASLANEKIAAGESKVITLTLTKSLTENNMGLINNTAEIAEDYNELGIQDSNSTAGNNAKGENDTGVAEVIISIKTGAEVALYTIFYMTIILGVVGILMIPITKLTKNKNTHKFDKI